jgi:hypothetical protein
MENKTLIWAGVAIIGIVTGAVTWLASIKADTSVILAVVGGVVIPILAALGYGELKANRQATETVQRQTNGSYTQVLDMMQRRDDRQQAMLESLVAVLQQQRPPVIDGETVPPPQSPTATV